MPPKSHKRNGGEVTESKGERGEQKGTMSNSLKAKAFFLTVRQAVEGPQTPQIRGTGNIETEPFSHAFGRNLVSEITSNYILSRG